MESGCPRDVLCAIAPVAELIAGGLVLSVQLLTKRATLGCAKPSPRSRRPQVTWERRYAGCESLLISEGVR